MLPVEMPIPARADVINGALEGLVRANVAIMRDSPASYPPLAETGVLFRPERGTEDWKTADRVLSEGGAVDCEDVTCYEAARLRLAGEPASVEAVPIGHGDFHAMLRRGNGRLEDPSMALITKEAMIMTDKPSLKIRKVGTQCIGSISIPLAGGQVLTSQTIGSGPTDMLRSALSEILNASQDPKVYSMLPVKAQLALLAIYGINELSNDGLRELSKDPRAKESEKKLATQLLQTRKESGDPGPSPASKSWFDPSAWGSVGIPMVAVANDHRNVPTTNYPQQSKNLNRPGNLPMSPVSSPAGSSPTGGAPMSPGGIIRTPTNTYSGPVTTSTGFQPGQTDPGSGLPIPAPGQMDPTGQFVWVGPQGATPGHWERPRGSTLPQQVIPPGQVQPGPGQYPVPLPPPGPVWGGPPMPPQYPGMPQWMPGYPPSMPPAPYGYPSPYGSPYGYPSPYGSPYGYGDPMAMLMAWGMPPVMNSDPSQIHNDPLSADEAAAIMLWGSGTFAEGAFPGYQQGPPPAPWYQGPGGMQPPYIYY